jgi:hypothetical protein
MFLGAVAAVIVVAVKSSREVAYGAVMNVVGFLSMVGLTAIFGLAVQDLNENAAFVGGAVCYGAILVADRVLMQRSG